MKILLLLILLLCGPLLCPAQIGGTGWTSKTVAFNVQWPYLTNETSRYWFTNNIYHCLVYSNDSPFQAGSTTLPRTEQRFNPDYTNGEIQYQATIKAAATENSYCVFQIHTGDAEEDAFGSTTFMLFWFTGNGGSVHDYSGTLLVSNLDNQWFQVNVDHNMVTHAILVWINKNLVWTQSDNNAGDFYFKDGAYEQDHSPTLQMDTYVTNILEWTSSGTNPPAAPIGLTATPAIAQIGLTWNASVNATDYNLKRAPLSGGPYTTLGSLTGTNYTDVSVTNGTTYYYVVTALDQFGESASSAKASATPVVPPRPVIGSVLSKNGNLILAVTNGSAQGLCYLLRSTNLMLPPAQWPRTATNTFNSSGILNFTNAESPNQLPQYYLLQTP